MKKLLFLTLVLALVLATAASAEMKRPDTKDATYNNPSLMVISGTLDQNSPTWNRAFNNVDPPSAACDFPLTLSSAGQYYDVFCITSTDDMPIEVIVDAAATTIGDTHMELYCDPFDPSDATANAKFSDDDDGDGLMSAFTISDGLMLSPGVDYWLVLTTFSAGDMGDFTINTSDNVVFCGGVGTESKSWTELKGLYR